MKTARDPMVWPAVKRALPHATESAFTMVEIAICIAVVAFALVAIIGVLPTGVRTQRDNREETIIGQDGAYWLEAIRSGAKGMDELTNYVDAITLEYRTRLVPTFENYVFGSGARAGTNYTFTNGLQVVGLLTTPKYGLVPGARPGFLSPAIFRVTALVRALNGVAKDKVENTGSKFVQGWDPYKQQNTTMHLKDMVFGYRLTSEISPYQPIPSVLIVTQGFTGLELSNRIVLRQKAALIQSNAYEVRLRLDWPVWPDAGGYRVGNNSKTFQAVVGGQLWAANAANLARSNALFYFQPSVFAPVQ